MGEANSTAADQHGAVAAVEQRFADRGEPDHLDGLTIETPEGWFNLRASNTEPLLRLNVEAPTPAAMARLRDEVAATVRDA